MTYFDRLSHHWVYCCLTTYNHTPAKRDVITVNIDQQVYYSCDTPDGHARLQAVAGLYWPLMDN